MISYTIVGSSGSHHLADLENRCNKVRRVFPNCDFRIIIKHPREWEEYIANVCKIYGFKKRSDPLGFTKEGRLIGGYEEIVKEIEEKFRCEEAELDEEDHVAPSLNERVAEQEYNQRNKLASLGDKIDEEFNSHLKKGDYNFHLEKFEVMDLGDKIVFGKYLQKITPDLEIPQTQEINVEGLDTPIKPFHIEEALKWDTKAAEEGEDGKMVGGNSPKKHNQEKSAELPPQIEKAFSSVPVKSKDEIHIKDETSVKSGGKGIKTEKVPDEVIETLPHPEGNVQIIDGAEVKSHQDGEKANSQHTKEQADSKKRDELKDMVNEIDQEELRKQKEEEEKKAAFCRELANLKPDVRTLKKWHVAHLGNYYELCLHPDPIFKKHCILAKNGRLKYDEGIATYRPYQEKIDKRVRITDFSKVQKHRVDNWSRELMNEEHNNLQYTTLNSRFLDFYKLFTYADLQTFDDLINQLDSFIFYRIMPSYANYHFSYMNYMVHVVRRQDLIHEMDESMHGSVSFSSIPLAEQIANKDGLVSDQEIYQTKKDEEERIRRRKDKIKRIEEQKIRRETREREAKEKAEAEAKLAEEWAQKEKEAARSPAKAAALRLEKERMELEKVEKEKAAKEALEKEKQEKELEKQKGLELSPVRIEDGELHPDDLEGHNLMVSGIPPIQPDVEEHKEYENPYREHFYQITSWNIPHKIYLRQPNQNIEQLADVLAHMVMSLENDFPEEINLEEIGLNFIMCKEFVLMIPITKAWMQYGLTPLFWEPWAYLGFYSLPILQKTWPETKQLNSTDYQKNIEEYIRNITS